MKKGIICFFLILAIGFMSNFTISSAAATPQDTVVTAITSLHEETFLPWNGGGPRKFYLDCIYESLIYLVARVIRIVFRPEYHFSTSYIHSSDKTSLLLEAQKGLVSLIISTPKDVQRPLARFEPPTMIA